jgi:hypothetical protein
MMTPDEMVALLNQSIPLIQQRLTEQDRIARLTVEQMQALLAVERAHKNRLGVAEWLKLGIEMGRLPDPRYYLGYHDRAGCFKSALQKYIRRSETEKALRAARSLWRMGKSPAVARLKIVIPEDTHLAIGLLDQVSDDLTEAAYLGVIRAIAEGPKDKSSCPLAIAMDEDKTLEGLVPDVALIRQHLMDRAMLPVVARHVFKLCKLERYEEVLEMLPKSKVVATLIGRQKAGVMWGDDATLLVVAAIRFVQGDYDASMRPAPVEPSAIQPLRLDEIAWFAFDFHTAVGRPAERIFLSRHREIDSKRLRRNWFMAESGKLEGKIVSSEWDTLPYDRGFWPKHGQEIERLILDMMKRFQLSQYGRVA